MAKKKGNCPRCGARMKLARRYCTRCGAANPLMFPQPVRCRPAAAATKAAGSTYAPVVAFRPGVPFRDPRWSAVVADPDPNGRDRLLRTHIPEFMDGGGAA